MTMTPTVTKLEAPQIEAAGAALGRAFFDDPLFAWMMPDAERRERVLPWLLTNTTRYGDRYGEVYTTGGSVEGAAIWFVPGKTDTNMFGMLRSGMALAPFKFGVGASRRAMTSMSLMEKLHKRDMHQRHWYLAVLGVDPPRQGQGVGGALIAPVLARADAEGLPCYLETAKEINVAFYRKHGFDVIVDDVIPNGGPRYWTMVRQPA
jgi:ribosomal protein S18 acetylase RimI-like enzyme